MNHRLSTKKIIKICSNLQITRWMPVKWKVIGLGGDYYDDRTRINVTIDVPDRDDGSPIRVTFPMSLPPCFSEEECLAQLHRILRDITIHELDEHLFYKGQRLHDPHQ